MEQEILEKNNKRDEDIWVHDSSVDYKGNLPVRASTGAWKASIFIIAIEFTERISFIGIATNLITYLTKSLHQDIATAAKNVNYWSGVSTLAALFGAFIADTYTGRFTTVLLASFIYLMGLSLLTMSQLIPSLKPCNRGMMCLEARKVHEVTFFLALYFLSIGGGGIKPNLQSLGADQFDDHHSGERKKKMSYFNWWNFVLACGLLFGVTVIAYTQDNKGWGIAGLILTTTMAVSVVTFYFGKRYYRYRLPKRSPLKPLFQVLVAALRKRKLPHPSDSSLLYEIPWSNNMPQGSFLGHTNGLRFLDKAAIVEDEEEHMSIEECCYNPWRLATVTKVEEMKLVLNLIPIWLTSLSFGICVSQGSTFFVKQASTMNRRIDNNFSIPPASIFAVGSLAMLISITIYEKVLVPYLRRRVSGGNERGITMLQRIGIGMVFSVLAMIVAALVERKRLKIVHKEQQQGGSSSSSLSMSMFWLAPQYVILGLGEGFTVVGLQEFFYHQVPDAMRSLGIAFFLTVLGLGSFLSSFLIIIVDRLTGKGGRKWIGEDLNVSRLDNFYWVVAAVSGLNFCVYALVARRYTYKNVLVMVSESDFNNKSDDG